MVVYKRKKNTRQRGSHTHGWGAKKKHRGAGNRGGRGMAGTGKRADSKKPSIWKNIKYFGKFGFKKKGVKKEIKPVNIIYLEENLEKLLSKKLIEKENDQYLIDLKKLGFNKLLGTGKSTKKFKITTEYASKKIIEQVKNAGGEVIITKKEEQKPTEAKKKEKPVEIKKEPVEKPAEIKEEISGQSPLSDKSNKKPAALKPEVK